VEKMFTLIKGAEVYRPDYSGVMDILISFDRIAWLGKDSRHLEDALGPGLSVVDAEGKLAVPGFIDQHVHISGGGGEGGFSTRTPEIKAEELLKNGITTAVGVLGTDGVTRNLEGLYAKAASLDEAGVTTYIYTGSYQVPVITFTGSIQRDLVLIDRVIGVGEIAISDHRSFNLSVEELMRIAAGARNGGMLSGKAGVVHLHVGDGSSGLDILFEAVRKSCVPPSQFVPTHVNRKKDLLESACEFAAIGGNIDLTAGIEPDEYCPDAVSSYKALQYLLNSGNFEDSITLSSDANGSIPLYDSDGRLVEVGCASCDVLINDIRRAVFDCGIPLEKILRAVTVNPARVLKLSKDKGSIEYGKFADILLLDRKLNISAVFARGVRVV